MTTNLPAEKKTKRIDAYARVIVADHACSRGMAWESPRVIFQLDDGTEYIWHSEQVEEILRRNQIWHGYQMVGVDYGVSMLVRGNRVWRMNRIYPV